MPSSHIETVLTSLGLQAEDAAAILGVAEADQSAFDVKPFVEKVKANYQTQFKNDPAFFDDITLDKLPADIKKKMESNQYGRAASITRDKLIKGLGMTDADYADLSDDQKEKLELFIPAIAEKYAKSKAGDKQLQQDLIEARKKLEAFGPDYEKGIETKYQTQAEQKYTQAIFNANLISELSTIEGLKISASDLAPIAAGILSGKYSFERNGDFAIELRQKDNPAMKVLKEGSSHELTLKEALQMIATDKKWVDVKDDKEDKKNGEGKLKIIPEHGKLVIAPHIQDKIAKKIAAEA